MCGMFGPEFLKRLQSYQKVGFLCDMVISSLEGTTINVHSVVIAASWPEVADRLMTCTPGSYRLHTTLSMSTINTMVEKAYTGNMIMPLDVSTPRVCMIVKESNDSTTDAKTCIKSHQTACKSGSPERVSDGTNVNDTYTTMNKVTGVNAEGVTTTSNSTINHSGNISETHKISSTGGIKLVFKKVSQSLPEETEKPGNVEDSLTSGGKEHSSILQSSFNIANDNTGPDINQLDPTYLNSLVDDEDYYKRQVKDNNNSLIVCFKRQNDGYTTKKFKCSKCHSFFVNKNRLRRHELKHDNIVEENKPYLCDMCPKSYHLQASLYNHKKVHDQKRYECEVCNKSFALKGNLLSHRKNVHFYNSLVCLDCQLEFHVKKDFLEHTKNCAYKSTLLSTKNTVYME